MTRRTASDILDTARQIVTGARQDTYGPPERNFTAIAAMWSAYLGHTVTAEQVAWCMVLLKVARAGSGHGTDDNAPDACGYASLAGELAPAYRTRCSEDAGEPYQVSPARHAEHDGGDDE